MRATECSLSRHLFIIGVRSGERGVRLHHEEDGAGEGDMMNACCDQQTFLHGSFSHIFNLFHSAGSRRKMQMDIPKFSSFSGIFRLGVSYQARGIFYLEWEMVMTSKIETTQWNFCKASSSKPSTSKRLCMQLRTKFGKLDKRGKG